MNDEEKILLRTKAHCSHFGTVLAGVYILQMTRILFPGRTDPAPKIFAIEGNPTPPN